MRNRVLFPAETLEMRKTNKQITNKKKKEDKQIQG